jgi:hypothetical protein
MAFELNKQLKGAEAVIKAASKDAARLKEVGVTAQELAKAKALLADVTAERRRYASQASAYLDASAELRGARAEAKRLASKVKRRIAIALSRDLAESAEVKQRAGIGARTANTNAAQASRALALVSLATDAKFAAAFKKRGVSAADVKRLKELGELLGDAGEPASATEKSALTDLFDLVEYFRDAADAVFETDPVKYQPYRQPRSSKRKPTTPQ